MSESEYLENIESFASMAIHNGQDPNKWANKEIMPPISLSTNYKRDVPFRNDVFQYTRLANPVRNTLETCLASLEQTNHCVILSSGVAAANLILQLVDPGDHIVVQTDIYHGIFKMFQKITAKIATVEYVDTSDLKAVEKLMRPNTKLVWCESPTNPVMKVIDIMGLTLLVKKISPSTIVACDNTFMSPYFQRPANLGVDLVMNSCSKYIGGHSDVLMGAICTNRDDLISSLRALQVGLGPVSSPFDCYLVLRSLKTLELRMQKHMSNALAVAKFLENHPMIEKVLHPGLPSHPQYEISLKQCYGHSGIFSFYVKKHDQKITTKILSNLNFIQVADSLGGCETTVKMCSMMPPGALTKDEMKIQGITDGLLRISVGLENEKDIIKDLNQALNTVSVDL